MKISCNVIEDLLPLYHDGVCSEDSRKMVEEHLRTCEKCGKMKRELDREPELEQVDEKKAIQGIRKSIRKRTLRAVALGMVIVLLAAACAVAAGYESWKREKQELLRFAEGKAAYVIYRHIGDSGLWDGNPEYWQWSAGDYRFKVIAADPFRGESVINVTPQDNSALTDDSAVPYIWIELKRNASGGYDYLVGVEKWTIGLQETFLVNRELELVEGTDAHQALLSGNQAEIRALIEAAEAQWPFLAE